MSTVTKRLHISGLTPSITASDLKLRLQSFGKVLALDGFGALDGIGQPRKFAYITLEATETNLTRCVNLLSGTTWKGAKLRIGEAKPDFAQRLQQERKHAAEEMQESPRKRRRLGRGVWGMHSKDMSIVTPENAQNHPGWQVTGLSHLIRPMKIRPLHPLNISSINNNINVHTKKSKRDKAAIPARARITVIDPRSYGSTHICGNMLESVIIAQRSLHTQQRESKALTRSPIPITSSPPSPWPTSLTQEQDGFLLGASQFQDETDVDKIDLAKEKSRNLGLLHEMFGHAPGDWGGDVSLDDEHPKINDDKTSTEGRAGEINRYIVERGEEAQERSLHLPAPVVAKKTEQALLKDLFKPQEDARFSLIANLGGVDLDLDLDLDPGYSFEETQSQPMTQLREPVSSLTPIIQSGVTLNTSLPLFFPQADNHYANDIFSAANMEGWQFGRSGDSESIRKRWEDRKGPLTKEWKKRAREAQKARRRHYGAAEGEDT